MLKDGKILFGKSGDKEVYLNLSMANRHGLISGATGTGKTVSLKVLAESFSDAGVPVFLADIKGDLASLAQMGADEKHVTERVSSMNLQADGFAYRSYPVYFWDLYGEMGMPLRAAVSEMGPILLSRVLGLNEIQSDVLSVVFKIADDARLLLIDTKDLKAMLNYVGEHAEEYEASYGRIAKATLTAILRAVVSLETEGADRFFGEPALNMEDLLQQDGGRGVISILDCRKLIMYPDMYSTLLLYMLSELYEMLPEAGDLDKPKLVFFFDEAHMLFDNASRDLLQRIEQTIKLIRSKGVGIFFVTQNPGDVPDGVMGQLGNKVQHALHAYSPKDMKQVKIAAETYRPNPDFDTAEAIQNLATGEAVVSLLDEKGIPGVAEKVQVLPPQSFNGACDDSLRGSMIKSCPLYARYASAVDRESAYETLQGTPEGQAAGKEAQQGYAGVQAPGNYAQAPGNYAQAPGNYAQAPQNSMQAPGYDSAAAGNPMTQAQGNYAQAPGNYAQAPGNYAQVSQDYAQTPGNYAQAPGNYAQALQNSMQAPGYDSAAAGNPMTQAQGCGQGAAAAGPGQMSALEAAQAEAKRAKAEAEAARKEAEKQIREAQKAAEKQALAAQKEAEKQQAAARKALEREEKRKKQEMSRVAKTITGTVGREIGKNIGSSFGSFGRRLGGNVGAQLGRSIMGTLFRN